MLLLMSPSVRAAVRVALALAPRRRVPHPKVHRHRHRWPLRRRRRRRRCSWMPGMIRVFSSTSTTTTATLIMSTCTSELFATKKICQCLVSNSFPLFLGSTRQWFGNALQILVFLQNILDPCDIVVVGKLAKGYDDKSPTTNSISSAFCSTSLPPASTRWVQLTLSSLCPQFKVVRSINLSNILRKILGNTENQTRGC